jgi:SulP family sulfate permease
MSTLEIVAGKTKAVILLMDEVHAMDATGLVALESALESLRKNKCLAILSGVRTQPMALLRKGHLDHREGVMLCENSQAALTAANRHVNGPSTPVPTPPISPPPNAQTQAS